MRTEVMPAKTPLENITEYLTAQIEIAELDATVAARRLSDAELRLRILRDALHVVKT